VPATAQTVVCPLRTRKPTIATSNNSSMSAETQLVHEIANTAWRLKSIPFLETELFSQNPNPQTPIPTLAWNEANSPKLPSSSCAISAKDFPGIPQLFPTKLASFFQKNNSSATQNT
jgi:hypothetical protein